MNSATKKTPPAEGEQIGKIPHYEFTCACVFPTPGIGQREVIRRLVSPFREGVGLTPTATKRIEDPRPSDSCPRIGTVILPSSVLHTRLGDEIGENPFHPDFMVRWAMPGLQPGFLIENISLHEAEDIALWVDESPEPDFRFLTDVWLGVPQLMTATSNDALLFRFAPGPNAGRPILTVEQRQVVPRVNFDGQVLFKVSRIG